ncbi:scavenger receptor class F member 1-like isoform X2 [Littorina saxatilis]|uniref:scavenger receptor class F member 1-like isoform X2 n=1 Tax=Littorina saxatilis TaxID=31220 RepID=UPI0038B5CC41
MVLMVNVAINKSYRQISKHYSHGPSGNAANGNTSGDYATTNCIHTRLQRIGHTGTDSDYIVFPTNVFHWWEVDLGRTYPVYTITVWARTGFLYRLYPFIITVDDQLCVNVTSPSITRKNSVTCSSVLYGQVVRLTFRRTDQPLNLCEFQIFVPSGVSQCPAGHHGAQCGQTCSDNCGRGPGKNFCYQDTGVCYDGCVGNFAGDFCKDCRTGYHGDQCTSPCTSLSSRCTQCSQDGTCTGCSGPFIPPSCSATCDNKTYGRKCSESCGQCKGRQPCDRVTGSCITGCQPGYTGQLCKTLQLDNEKDSLVVPVVGSVIGAAIIIAIAIVGAVCWYRRSREEFAENRDRSGTIGEPGITHSDSSGVQPPSSATPHEDTTYYEISDTDNTHEMREVQHNYDMLHPYSNDDADRQPYSQITPHVSDVTRSPGNTANTNTSFS